MNGKNSRETNERNDNTKEGTIVFFSVDVEKRLKAIEVKEI